MAQTEKQYPLVPSDTCYLYILATGEMKYHIGMAGNPKLEDYIRYDENSSEVKAAKQAPARLVYYRRFDDTLTALGFKRLLESMAPRSVEFIIRRSNPDLETLQLDSIAV